MESLGEPWLNLRDVFFRVEDENVQFGIKVPRAHIKLALTALLSREVCMLDPKFEQVSFRFRH